MVVYDIRWIRHLQNSAKYYYTTKHEGVTY